MDHLTRILIVTVFLIFLCFSLASALELGQEVSDFQVFTADRNPRDRERFGKEDLFGVINVVFYEDRWTVQTNASLKYDLDDLVENDSDRYDDVRLVQIIDTSSANIFTGTIYRRNLLRRSQALGIPIYADWNGSLIGKFGLAAGRSNVLIIDSDGILRFRENGPIRGRSLELFLKPSKACYKKQYISHTYNTPCFRITIHYRAQ